MNADLLCKIQRYLSVTTEHCEKTEEDHFHLRETAFICGYLAKAPAQ